MFRFIYRLIGILLLPASAYAQASVSIEISGIDQTLETNVRHYLSLVQQKDSDLLTAIQIQRLHLRADKEIAAALQPYGYYHPQVESSLSQEDGNNWRAVYRIDAGNPLLIGIFDFTINGEMATDPEFRSQIRPGIPEAGARFSHIEYEDIKAGLNRLAAENGYFSAKFVQHRVEIDVEANLARVYLHYDSGRRYRFGELKLEQSVLNDELLRRFATFKSGDPYSLDLLLQFQQLLNDTQYFQVVEVSPGQPVEDSYEIPIALRLTPRNRHLFKIGFGYGTDTGARARFGWQMPRVNPQGHHIDAEISVSEIGHEVLGNYRIPVLNPRTDQIVLSAGEKEEKFETGTSTKRSVGISLNHGVGQWRETLSLEFQQEDFSIDNEDKTSDLLLPGGAWTRTWGKGFINVLDGIRLDLSVRGADSDFASDADFIQYGVNIKFITSLSGRDRIIMRGAAATIETDNFDEIPSSIRYYAGGANSVRGYAYQSLGPTDDDGDAVGGRRLLVGSIEYEHYFSDKWGLAIFTDAGNALDDFNDDLEQGVGFGVRWKSPVGPVRVDLANAITTDNGWRLHINIGPDL